MTYRNIGLKIGSIDVFARSLTVSQSGAYSWERRFLGGLENLNQSIVGGVRTELNIDCFVYSNLFTTLRSAITNKTPLQLFIGANSFTTWLSSFSIIGEPLNPLYASITLVSFEELPTIVSSSSPPPSAPAYFENTTISVQDMVAINRFVYTFDAQITPSYSVGEGFNQRLPTRVTYSQRRKSVLLNGWGVPNKILLNGVYREITYSIISQQEVVKGFITNSDFSTNSNQVVIEGSISVVEDI